MNAAARPAAPPAATTAAPPAARPAASPPASPFLNPQVAAGSAQSNALAELFRLMPLAAGLRIHRTAPAWCRGYLEDTDHGTIRGGGGLHRYIADTWGGDRYWIELTDGDGAPMGPGWPVSVVGPVRDRGAPVDPPRSQIVTPPPVVQFGHAPPVPVYPPAAPAAPAVPSAVDELRAELRRLASDNADLRDELRRRGAPAPNPPPAPAPAGGVRETVAQLRDTLEAARELSDAAAEFAPAPPPAPPVDDRHSPIAREVMRGLARKVGEKLWSSDEPDRGNGDGRRPPPAAGARHFDDGAEPVADAEIIP